ncbi:MAG: hypothetical protein QM613_01585 [Micrococcaceae bacterium]
MQQHPVLVIGPEDDVSSKLLALCQATGNDAWHYISIPDDSKEWKEAPKVLISAKLEETVRNKRTGVALIKEGLDEDLRLYKKAIENGAEEVFSIEGSIDKIVDFINQETIMHKPSIVIVIHGTCGQVGTTSLAISLAQKSVKKSSCLLIDTHRLHNGLARYIEGDGYDWGDFIEIEGRISSHYLEDSLPNITNIPCLTWFKNDSRKHNVSHETFYSVLKAAEQKYDFIIIDWAAHEIPDFLLPVHHVVLLRARCGDAEIANTFGTITNNPLLVLTGKIPPGVTKDLIEEVTKIPLSYHLKEQKSYINYEQQEPEKTLKALEKTQYPELATHLIKELGV